MTIDHSRDETESMIEFAKPIVLRALHKAFDKYKELGDKGLEKVKKNQYGDTALRMDIEAEEAVLASLQKDNFPARIISEEHGVIDIGKPEFIATLDGIDGTALYKKDRLNGRYGTILSVLQGLDPHYNDYIMGSIMQHATGRALTGIKGRGAFAITPESETRIHTSGNTTFDTQTLIYIEEFFDINRQTFSEKLKGYNTACETASSLYYADLAEGRADFALNCTFKDNLEIAAAYGLIREAGGAVIDMHGNDIGAQKYHEFGQKEHAPFIAAATTEQANNMLNFLKK